MIWQQLGGEFAPRRTLVKCPLIFGLLCTSIGTAEQPTYSVFDPMSDCDQMPALIRDAAKDAGISTNLVCYISDRPKFALKVGEAFARDLDRVGDMVRVVVPFGHLLLVNGTEFGVQIAVRFYDAENRKHLTAARFAGEQGLSLYAVEVHPATEAALSLRRSYTSFFTTYNHANSSAIPHRSRFHGRK